MSFRLLSLALSLSTLGWMACSSSAEPSVADDVPIADDDDAQAALDAGKQGSADATSDATAADAAPDAALESTGCEASITAPPASLGLDAFYTQYLDARGIPVIASDAPDGAALRVVCRLAVRMLQKRDDVRLAAIERSLRIGVMGKDQVTTDMPEHADLNEAFPPTNWDERARGLGATLARPLSSCAEENVSCLAGDPYRGENIFVHEFSHSLYGLGVVPADPAFAGRLQSAYDASMAAGRYANTYAASNVDEYWAEGVQSFFDVNLEAIPANGIHNEVNTRGELEAYDPALYALIAEIFAVESLPLCP